MCYTLFPFILLYLEFSISPYGFDSLFCFKVTGQTAEVRQPVEDEVGQSPFNNLFCFIYHNGKGIHSNPSSQNLNQDQSRSAVLAKEVMFLPLSVCWLVCWITQKLLKCWHGSIYQCYELGCF